MKEFIIAMITLLGGFFLGKHQERWKNKAEIERQKRKLFCLIQDLESRREKDLECINDAFSTAILVEKGLMKKDQFITLSLPRKIEGKPIEDTFYSVIESFEFGYREGVRALLVNIHAVNKQLGCLYEKFNSEENLTSNDLINIHGQIITYSYLVHELNMKKERYIYNGKSNKELLDVAAKAFGVNYHIDDIVAERLKHTTKTSS
ncbi:hypothetical protein ACOX9X_10400 [Photobacterium leiognathi subsp. mandapamensis]|uniref:hypothetical protein n=2 Tax=Photobacterium leiognathi TaxID=553611 RepID=UPI003BF49E65